MSNPRRFALFLAIGITGIAMSIWWFARSAPSAQRPPALGVASSSHPTSTSDVNAASVRIGSGSYPASDAAGRNHEIIPIRADDSLPQRIFTIEALDDSGHAIPDADVWVIPDEKLSIPVLTEIDPASLRAATAKFTGTTSESGTLAWPLPRQGAAWLVIARRSGWHTGYVWLDLSARPLDGVEVRLIRRSNVHGIVVDAVNSAPLSGAVLVAIPRYRPESGSTSQRMELDRYLVGERCTTAPDGKFVFDTLRDEDHDLYCFALNRSPIHLELARPQGQDLTIRFGETVRVSGFVFDEQGAPIESANVRAERCGVLPVMATDAVHSDAEGRFFIDAVHPGPTLLRVDKRGFGSVKQLFDLKADSAPVEVTLGPEVELAGHVFDAMKRPLAGVRVAVRDVTQGTTLGEMDTQEDGGWWMYWVPPHHRIDIELEKSGFTSTFLSAVEVPAKDLSITLQRMSSIAGVVLDEHHEPIPDFTVLHEPGHDRPMEELEDRLHYPIHPVHSPDGHFDLTDVAPGPQELTIRADGFVPKVLGDVTTKPGERLGPIEIVLERGLEIHGRIVDAANQGVADAEVLNPTRDFAGVPFLSDHLTGVRSASDGSFTLAGAARSFALVVRAPGCGSALFSDLRAADFPRDLPISAPGSIVGQVTTPWQSPDTCLRIRASQDRSWVCEEVHPDVSGRFRFAALSPGRYRLDLIDDWQLAELTSDATISRWTDVRSGETTSVDLAAEGDGAIEGRITGDPSIGRERLQLLVFRGDDVNGAPEACASVDEWGLFHATQLAPGPCRLRLTSAWAGVAVSIEQSATIHGGGTPTHVEFHVDKSSASGHVTDSTGNPIDAFASLVADPSGAIVATVRTDSSGLFRIFGAPSSAARIHASANSFADAWSEPLDFKAVAPPNVELHLDPESRLLVSVRDDLGAPVPSATVALYVFAYPDADRRSATKTDSHGQITIPRLPAGRVQLSASAAGHVDVGPLDAALARGEDRHLDVVLTRTGTLLVAALDPKGRPARQIPFTIHLIQPTSSDPPRAVTTDGTGGARVEALRPGHYQIRHGELDSFETDVLPGAVARVSITISP
jgi:hypothetical protein